MNTTKKSLFRVLLITLCFIALGMFFQTGKSSSLYSPEPLPTIEMTLRPGVDWVTIRNLSVEASTIWQENGQVFAFSRPLINNARDAALYQELLEDRLNSLPDTQILTAEVTFKAPLSLTEVESLLGQTAIISLLASGNGGSTGQVAYPPDDIPAEFQDEFSQVFESLSGGTPAPNLSPDQYVAAKVSANALLFRDLAQKERVFTVDVGPVDLINDFPNGNFSALKDVSYDYELHVGSVCEFTLLRNRIDDLSTNGEISEAVRGELKDLLTNSEIYLNANNVASARSVMMQFFETLAENMTIINEGVLKEVGIIGDCMVARNMQLISFNLYLHGSGATANPATLFLDGTLPITTTAKYKDTASLKFSGGNLWKDAGTWTASPSLSEGDLSNLNELEVWLGLKNSDDQGTNFDLRVEVYKNNILVGSAESPCVKGITRNPDLAKQVILPFGSLMPTTFNGTTDVLSVKIKTRIGTNGTGGMCGGHSNAVGLRLYFDASNRLSGVFAP